MKKSSTSIETVFTHLFSSQKNVLLKELHSQLQGRTPLQVIFTPNLEQIALANTDKAFTKALGLAHFLLPDGMGLVWGARFLQQFGKAPWVRERISGREVVADLLSEVPGQKFLILGGRGYDSAVSSTAVATPGSLACFQLTPSNMHPESTLYWTPGFQQAQQPSDEEIAQVGKLLKQLKPTVVFVALGAPQQEFWILDNAAVLQAAGTKLAMAVGGSFDVLFGKLT